MLCALPVERADVCSPCATSSIRDRNGKYAIWMSFIFEQVRRLYVIQVKVASAKRSVAAGKGDLSASATAKSTVRQRQRPRRAVLSTGSRVSGRQLLDQDHTSNARKLGLRDCMRREPMVLCLRCVDLRMFSDRSQQLSAKQTTGFEPVLLTTRKGRPRTARRTACRRQLA